ncbi:MAG: hypothetical protein LBJ82_04540 [Deltaproteobacteria bacterium]|jgi:hypothetical protein|nr:hypothetical protein [Deltaproteobacteria bacterium]
MLTRRLNLFLAALLVLASLPAAPCLAAPFVPQIVAAMGRQLDRQVAARLHQKESPAQGVSLLLTTPVDVNDLEKSNPLARQIQEELASWFAQAGYSVREIRKGADLLFAPGTGELLLTRRSNLVGDEEPGSSAIVAGTYTVTPRQVRFNIRLILTGSQEILAMTSMSIPVNSDVAALLSQDGLPGRSGAPIAPTVVTLLP